MTEKEQLTCDYQSQSTFEKSESVRESVVPDITISDQGQCPNHECYCCMSNFK